MTWFLLALVGPLLYAATNHIDKFLLDGYFEEEGVGTLLLFSAFLSAAACPVLFLLDRSVFSVAPVSLLALALVGMLNVAVLWLYLTALKQAEPSVTVVFYQLVPVFGYGLGYLILGEALTALQLSAMAVIICGTTIISFEFGAGRRMRLRTSTLLLMIGAAFCWGLESVIFKAVALEENVWRSLFWEHLMLAFAGLGIFTFMQSYRRRFMAVLRAHSLPVLSLNVANEGLYILGNIAFSCAYMLAPVALVLLAESYQPLFVLALGAAIAVIAPRIASERLSVGALTQKIAAISVTGVGTYLLFVAGNVGGV